MVTPILAPSGNILYNRTGDPDFYAIFEGTGVKSILRIHYDGRNVLDKNPILEPAYTHPLFGRGPDPENPIRSDLEVFLLTIYFANLYLGSDKIINDLHADLVAAGITAQYDTLNVIDFMVLTGAKEREYRKPDNTVGDIMTLGSADPRPTLLEVDDTPDGNELMIEIIKYRGFRGFIPNLYAKKGISFEDLVDLVKHFFPDLTDRANYYANELGPQLKLKQVPIFTTTQLKALELL